jgi:hypothetical protein
MWDWVRNGLEVVRRTRPACTWLPEDVYHELMTGAAHLYVIGSEDGFIVVKRCVTTYERVLFVWAIWGAPGTLVRHKDKIMAGIDDLARSAGLSVIRMDTTRDSAWAASKLFVPVSTIFEREVTA